MKIQCFKCRDEVTLTWLLANCFFYWPELPEPNVFGYTCPSCGTEWEFQVDNGRIWLGYVYAAARGHFANMELREADGLSVYPATDSVAIEYEGQRRLIPKQPAA